MVDAPAMDELGMRAHGEGAAVALVVGVLAGGVANGAPAGFEPGKPVATWLAREQAGAKPGPEGLGSCAESPRAA